MEDLLFLVHRIPFPPRKGDKVRSYHLLKHLRRKYRVHLGTFIDDPVDWGHVSEVRKMCEEAFFAPLTRRTARLRSLKGFITGTPLTLPYYTHKGLQTWVDNMVIERSIERVLVFSSAMAQYATHHIRAGMRSVIDFVDVDSDKWRQYAEKTLWPMNWLYRRESRKLMQYERSLARVFDASVFVSEEETKLFRKIAPEAFYSNSIVHVNNGVDTDYFSPHRPYSTPYPADEQVLVFTGAMDYWANVDAVTWFSCEVFPRLYANDTSLRFYIVGARPTAAVRELNKHPGVKVTGTVDDIRPYIACARMAVAPLRIARGVQNKVLEAMAMAKPILVSPSAIEGIESGHDLFKFATADAGDMANQALALLNKGDTADIGARAREFVMAHYDWEKNLRHMTDLLEVKRTGSTSVR